MYSAADEDGEGGCDTRNFFDMTTGKTLQICLPELHGKQCIGTSIDGGVVVYIRHDMELRVFNLFMGECLPLPPLSTLWTVNSIRRDRGGRVKEFVIDHRNYTPHYVYRRFYTKAAVCPSEDRYVVAFIHGYFVSVARTGDEAWTKLDCSYGIKDVMFHGGRLYAVNMQAMVVTWELLDPSSFSWSEPKRFGPWQEDTSIAGKYLVALPGNIDTMFQVWRHVEFTDVSDDVSDDDPVTYKTLSVKVLKSDLIHGTWVEVKDLGGHIFFLGHNHPIVLQAREFPQLRSDCIYFTDDNMECMLYDEDVRCLDRDMGVFSVESGSWEQLPLPGPLVNYPSPIWVALSPS
uniref:F-box protein SKIP23 n=1 Tax=Anthurium amnicola TaxID=1678845 RepID=A0A1D1XK96_9ARAE